MPRFTKIETKSHQLTPLERSIKMQIQCSSCRAMFSIGDEWAGQTLPCANCQQPIQIPHLQVQMQPFGEAQEDLSQHGLDSPKSQGEVGSASLVRNGPSPLFGFLIGLAGLPCFVSLILLDVPVLLCSFVLAAFLFAGGVLVTLWKRHSPQLCVLLGLTSPIGLLIAVFLEDRREMREPTSRSAQPALGLTFLVQRRLVGSARTRVAASAKCLALAFSPDGRELAGLFKSNRSQLLVWDVDSGNRVFAHDFKRRHRQYESHPEPLQWFPSRKKWLLGGLHLFDRRSKRITWTLKPAPYEFRAAVKVISDKFMIGLIGSKEDAKLGVLKTTSR